MKLKGRAKRRGVLRSPIAVTVRLPEADSATSFNAREGEHIFSHLLRGSYAAAFSICNEGIDCKKLQSRGRIEETS